MTETYRTSSPLETEQVGEALCRRLLAEGKRRAFIALRGEMGVGKTAFTRGFSRPLSVTGVKSPSYTVVNEYKGTPIPLFHFDLYRLTDEDDLLSVGYEDYLLRDGYLLCEWSERLGSHLPDDAVIVEIEREDDEDHRLIRISTVVPPAAAHDDIAIL